MSRKRGKLAVILLWKVIFTIFWHKRGVFWNMIYKQKLLRMVDYMWKKVKPYVISILIALAVGGFASFLTRNSMDIYKEIELPPLAPPSILFPIVWSILYVLMGIGAAMIYLRKDEAPNAVRDALSVYGINLVLNFMWSIIFFKFRAFLLAFVWLISLLAVIIKMIFDFKKIKPIAGYLQIPYAVWVTFAGYLNFAIWWLNR